MNLSYTDSIAPEDFMRLRNTVGWTPIAMEQIEKLAAYVKSKGRSTLEAADIHTVGNHDDFRDGLLHLPHAKE